MGISTYIPNLPYLTILDHYAIVSVIVIFAMVAQVYFLHELDDDAIAQIFAALSFGLFCVIQCAFVVHGYCARRYETKKLTMSGADYEKFAYTDKTKSSILYGYRENAAIDGKLSEILEKKGIEIEKENAKFVD